MKRKIAFSILLSFGLIIYFLIQNDKKMYENIQQEIDKKILYGNIDYTMFEYFYYYREFPKSLNEIINWYEEYGGMDYTKELQHNFQDPFSKKKELFKVVAVIDTIQNKNMGYLIIGNSSDNEKLEIIKKPDFSKEAKMLAKDLDYSLPNKKYFSYLFDKLRFKNNTYLISYYHIVDGLKEHRIIDSQEHLLNNLKKGGDRLRVFGTFIPTKDIIIDSNMITFKMGAYQIFCKQNYFIEDLERFSDTLKVVGMFDSVDNRNHKAYLSECILD